MTMDLSRALWLDASVVGIAALVLVTGRNTRHSHPGLIYLFFHVLVFTLRGWAIQGGAVVRLNLSLDEASRALFMADVFLACATLAWFLPPPRRWTEPKVGGELLRPSVVKKVALVAMPIGLYSLATHSYAPGSAGSQIDFSTSYQIVAVTWPGLLLLALIYLYGFRWYLVTPLLVFLAFMAVQGESRFRVVLPAILLGQMWLDRSGKKWPTPRVMLALALLFPIFLGMDALGTSYRDGTLTVGSSVSTVSDSLGGGLQGQANDLQGLDALGIAITQSQRYGAPLYGRHYLDLVFLPVPRPWWPDKPALNEHIISLSTPDRPLKSMGGVLTLPGSIYADWRWPGIVLGGFILARLGVWFMCRAYARGYGSTGHFFYILVAAALIQVYRDSLGSLVTFMAVKNAPLIAILIINHYRSGKLDRPSSPDSAAASGQGQRE